jgi:hypothetical protein
MIQLARLDGKHWRASKPVLDEKFDNCDNSWTPDEKPDEFVRIVTRLRTVHCSAVSRVDKF